MLLLYILLYIIHYRLILKYTLCIGRKGWKFFPGYIKKKTKKQKNFPGWLDLAGVPSNMTLSLLNLNSLAISCWSNEPRGISVKFWILDWIVWTLNHLVSQKVYGGCWIVWIVKLVSFFSLLVIPIWFLSLSYINI